MQWTRPRRIWQRCVAVSSAFCITTLRTHRVWVCCHRSQCRRQVPSPRAVVARRRLPQLRLLHPVPPRSRRCVSCHWLSATLAEWPHARVARDRRQCCDALVDLLRRKFDIHLDLFEMYALRNIFRVPSDLQVRKGFGANAVTWADRGNSVAVETPGRVYGRYVSTHNSVHRGGRGAG